MSSLIRRLHLGDNYEYHKTHPLSAHAWSLADGVGQERRPRNRIKGMENSFAGMLNSILIHLVPFRSVPQALEVPAGKAIVCIRPSA